MLTPVEIQAKDFKKELRGYKVDEVDSFLDVVIKDYEQLLKENASLKESLERLSSKIEHYSHMEDTLHNTLIVAQETAEGVKLNAKKEGELIQKEAEVRAAQIVEEAMLKARKAAADYEEMQKQIEVFRNRMYGLLQAQLEMLKPQE